MHKKWFILNSFKKILSKKKKRENSQTHFEIEYKSTIFIKSLKKRNSFYRLIKVLIYLSKSTNQEMFEPGPFLQGREIKFKNKITRKEINWPIVWMRSLKEAQRIFFSYYELIRRWYFLPTD